MLTGEQAGVRVGLVCDLTVCDLTVCDLTVCDLTVCDFYYLLLNNCVMYSTLGHIFGKDCYFRFDFNYIK